MAKPKAAPEDVALVLGATEDASQLAVLRKRGERVEAAVLAKAEEGKPVHGDLVKLTPRDEPQLYDVETLHEAPTPTRSGPAQVSSDAYRAGWDRLFAPKRRRALN
ncbi:MAG: hypothetical protein H6719_29585 [Sandaracinaceae bacterium]|nr:hypothetical protein [Sandaracinaceae bacterium]